MIETWRWFDPNDPITLKKVAQAGASGVVSSLNEIATGEEWPLDEILKRKATIEKAGLHWSVIESIPVHNDIKTRTGDYVRYIENYKASLKNAAKAGVNVICYNFMPVVDWTRTNLNYPIKNTGLALRFDMIDFVAYDVFILKRKNAHNDYQADLIEQADIFYQSLSDQHIALLESNIIAGLPGGEGSYTQNSIRTAIEEFIRLGEDGLRANLLSFLADIVPTAQDAGVKLCIHPDDPPFSLFGLPRVVSTQNDIRLILEGVNSPANGLTLCAGSFGVRADNDLVGMVKEFGHKIYFTHLRNVVREPNGSFYEAEHLDGDNDMLGLIQALLTEEKRRELDGVENYHIPMRPDHGHLLADEESAEKVNPGYSYAGRMKGLAELRGVIHTLTKLQAN